MRFWWHRIRGHKFALRAPDSIVCLADLTVLPRGGRYRRVKRADSRAWPEWLLR